MAIAAEQVKQLRDKTGAGFMECKWALEAAGGNIEEAITILRKKGLAIAAKKAGRIAKDGLVGALLVDGKKVGVLVEVNCETDFVAKTDEFKNLVKRVAAHIAAHRPERVRPDDAGEGPALYTQPVEGTTGDWNQFISEKIAKIGENIVVRRFVRYQGGYCEAYIHAGGKIGVLVELAGVDPSSSDAAQEMARDLAMHIAASDPRYKSREEVTPEDLAREREIYREQALKEGKPANVLDKIVEGKLSKFYSEVCLYDQAFVKDPDITVGKLIASRTAPGSKITLKRYTRYRLGE
ncbi:MAG TPA: translation elongation factor Ts [Acidobacteriota bacterium]|jgi:elongation factor Ts|nr:translation elongation factor Ts [Acidobacteriota bacterium]